MTDNVVDLSERRNRPGFTFDSKKLIVKGSGKVTVTDAIALVCTFCKEPVVSLDAVYDFKEVPVEFHVLLANFIAGSHGVYGVVNHQSCVDKHFADKSREKPKLTVLDGGSEKAGFWTRCRALFRRSKIK